MNGAIEQFRAAISAAGLTPPHSIETDGKLRRFSSSGKHGDDAGWYLLHGDGIPAGAFGDWRTGIEQTWRQDIGRKLTFAEAESLSRRSKAAKQQREAEQAQRRQEAQERARSVWKGARPASDHPYLQRKHVKPYGLRVSNGRLLVPMVDIAGELRSLQFIDADGDKRYLTGGLKTGCYHAIGKPNGVLHIAEGYATAASIHQATSHAVAVAFDAANLEPVALALRAKYPDLRIVVCADDDYRTEGNPGITRATEAARAAGGLVAVPDFGTNRPDGASDFNDAHVLLGADVVRRCIDAAKPPEPVSASVHAPDIQLPQLAAADSTAANLRGPVIDIVRADAIKPEAVQWLWRDYIALGALHLIAGAPGTGKTTLALKCAATVSAAGRWPDGTRATASDVLIWSGEDAAANTLVPRLIAMGANMTRVHIVRGVNAAGERRWFDPAKDFPALALEAARLPELRLMIVDPIVSAVAGDSHKNSETRRGLQPLVEFAERISCALYGVTHFSKASSARDPIERVTGSIAFAAVARVIMATAKLPEDDGGGRVFVRSKSNIGPDGGGFRYELRQGELYGKHQGIIASRVEWGAPIEGTAREILSQAETVGDGQAHDRPERDDAIRWLRALLSDGPRSASEVQAEAKAAGISLATLRRAKGELLIDTYREGGFGPTGAWVWRLKDAQNSYLTRSGEHLSQNPHGCSLPAKVLSEDSRAPLSVNEQDSASAEVF